MNAFIDFIGKATAYLGQLAELNTDLQVAVAVVLLTGGIFLMEWLVGYLRQRVHEQEKLGKWVQVAELSSPFRLFLFALLLKVARIPLDFPGEVNLILGAIEDVLIVVAAIIVFFKVVSLFDRAQREIPEDIREAIPDRTFAWFRFALRLSGILGAIMIFIQRRQELMPAWLLEHAWWRYVLIVIVILIVFLLSQVVSRFLLRLTTNARYSIENVRLRLLMASAVWPIRFLLFTLVVYAIREILRLPAGVDHFAGTSIHVLGTLAVFVFAYKLVAVMEFELSRLVARTDNLLDRNFVQLARFLARFVVIMIGGVYIIRAISGQPLSALLAGLGIGGLAIALAAQDTLKNLFGSVMIMMDKPFSIGQRVIVENTDGVVEDIGFRSTRVRTLTGHLVTVPNEKMANSSIENIGERPYIRRLTNITITYDTPVAKVRKAVETIREILDNHEGMDPEFPPRVFFNEFNDTSLNILVIYWYHPNDFWAFSRASEEINLRIMECFEAEGIEFAFPTSTTYLAQDEKRPLHIRVSETGPAKLSGH